MLAIVIPYYKINFFEETLWSLANQTDKRFKVYIGDDASLEDPTALLENYQGKFDFVYHRFETNLGAKSLTQQWERCITLSYDEEWIMILGDDDILGENVVAEFHSNLPEIEQEKINVVRFATQKINDFGMSISDVYNHPKIEKTVSFLFRDTRSSLSEYVFLKSQVINIGFKNFPLAWFSDVLAVLEFSNFKKIFTINKAVLKIRISTISISGKKDNLKLKSKAVFDYYEYLIANKSQYFDCEQKKFLICSIGKCYINDKKNIIYFLKISKIYLISFMFKQYFDFIQSVFNNSLKNASRL